MLSELDNLSNRKGSSIEEMNFANNINYLDLYTGKIDWYILEEYYNVEKIIVLYGTEWHLTDIYGNKNVKVCKYSMYALTL